MLMFGCEPFTHDLKTGLSSRCFGDSIHNSRHRKGRTAVVYIL